MVFSLYVNIHVYISPCIKLLIDLDNFKNCSCFQQMCIFLIKILHMSTLAVRIYTVGKPFRIYLGGFPLV